MGSAESLGALHIEVGSPNYTAGESITGTIHMLVKQPVSANTVLLFLKCTERTEWHETLNRGTKRSRTVKRSGKNRVLRQRFEVFKVPTGSLQPGQFSFPFTIQSPADLKNSFSYEEPWVPILSDGRVIGRIGYKLVAKVDTVDAHIDKGECPINFTRPMTEVTSSADQETTANIKNWCCMAKGSVKVKATFDKVAYLPGETAVVTVEADNQESKLPVTGYRVTLHRLISLRATGGHTKLIHSTVNSAEIDVMIAPGSHPSDSGKQLELMIPSNESVEKATTAQGTILTCVYTLTAEAVMGGWLMCCGQPTRVEVAVTIYPPEMEKPEAPKLDGEWQPKTMPKRQFSAGPEHEYVTKAATEVELGE